MGGWSVGEMANKRRREPGSKGPPVTKPKPGSLPTKEQILEYVQAAQGKVGNREIARAFHLKGGDRIEMKRLLREMTDDGQLLGNRKALKQPGQVPAMSVMEIVARDKDGELVAEPVVWEQDGGPKPRALVLMQGGRRRTSDMPLSIGDRILARVSRLKTEDVFGYRYECSPIKKLPRERRRQLGIWRPNARGGGGTIEPVERRELKAWPVRPGNDGGAASGDLVRFDVVRAHRQGVPEARIVEALGNPDDQRQISLIAVHAHGLRDEFPEPVLDELKALPSPEFDKRTDLRDVPLLTIDPVDARDHDDAVHAVPDDNPKNAGGFVVMVAIADVACYVRPGSRLDREALMRGNSVYFPDRVVPMLPEKISNDLCSLREAEDRPCLAVRMIFDAQGNKRRHTFHRAVMRSVAKLSYQEAQAAIDGKPNAKCVPLLEPVLKPLWQAYAALKIARDRREPLDLDLPERKILLDKWGKVERIVTPERLEAHRLIEEFMIQANVAAAETLEEKRTPCVYRVHDQPGKEKLTALRDFLDSLELSLPASDRLKPGHFNGVLAKAKGLPSADLVNEVVLRSQAQAVYATQNIGHFGLNLQRYAHFTSPIRRYADLLVHRALIRALQMGSGGLSKEEEPQLTEMAQSISEAERRAMAAERETSDRLIAAYLADRVGAEFPARISGVTRAGLFVRLKETGADGFIPASTLGGGEFWRHDETAHALVGDRTGHTYRLGDDVDVRLVEAIPTAGALRFEMLSDAQRSQATARMGRGPKRLRQRNRRRY
jgi:ribonuclease R